MSQSVSVRDVQEAIAVLDRWKNDNGPLPAVCPDLVQACAELLEQILVNREGLSGEGE